MASGMIPTGINADFMFSGDLNNAVLCTYPIILSILSLKIKILENPVFKNCDFNSSMVSFISSATISFLGIIQSLAIISEKPSAL